jgi:hypothetical protein
VKVFCAQGIRLKAFKASHKTPYGHPLKRKEEIDEEDQSKNQLGCGGFRCRWFYVRMHAYPEGSE